MLDVAFPCDASGRKSPPGAACAAGWGGGAAGEEWADETCVMGHQTLPTKDLKDDHIGTCEGHCLCEGAVTSQAATSQVVTLWAATLRAATLQAVTLQVVTLQAVTSQVAAFLTVGLAAIFTSKRI